MATTLKSTLVSSVTLIALTALMETIMSDPSITSVTAKVDADGNNLYDAEGMVEVDARVNTLNLEVILELLTAEKKQAKSVDESLAVVEKTVAKAKAILEGTEKAKTLKVGDLVTFTMGSGKGKKTFTLPCIKFSDKTFTVEFTEEYTCTTSVSAPTGKKHPKLSAILEFSTPVSEEVAA